MRKLVTVIVLHCLCHFATSWAAPTNAQPASLPDMDLVELSPSGNAYAFLTGADEAHKLLAVTTTRGEILYSAAVGDAKVRSLRWAGDNHLLIALAVPTKLSVSGHDYEPAIVTDLRISDKRVSRIFKDEKHIEKFVFEDLGSADVSAHTNSFFIGMFKFGANVYGYPLNRVLFKVDLDSEQAKPIAQDDIHSRYWTNHDWVLDESGSILAHSEYENQKGIWRLYRGEGHDNPLLPERKCEPDQIRLVGRGRSTGTVLVIDASQNPELVDEISTATGQDEKIFDGMSAAKFLFDPNTGLLAGAITDNEPGAYFFDAKQQARYRGTVKAFPHSRVRLVSVSRNLDRLIVKTDGADDHGTYWLVDAAAGSADRIGKSSSTSPKTTNLSAR